MGEFAQTFDRTLYNNDNIQKLVDEKHITPQTADLMRQKRDEILNSATAQGEQTAKTSAMEQKRADYEMGANDLQAKVNDDMNREPGLFSRRLSADEARTKYAKEAAHLAQLKTELDLNDQAQAQAAQPPLSPDGTAQGQNAAFGPAPAPAMPQVPMTDLGPKETGTATMDQIAAPYTQGIDMAQQGVGMQMQAAATKGKEEAALYSNMAKDLQNSQAQMAANNAKRDEFVNTRLKDIDDEQRKISEMKIDPDRYVHNMGTMQKIFAVLSIATSRAGGNKQAGNMITDAITRDVDAQKADIGQKRTNLSDKISVFERYKDKFKDDETARLASLDTGLKVAQMKINQVAAQTGSQDVQGRLMGVYGELEQKRAAIKAELASRLAGQYGSADGVNVEAMDEKKRERYVPGFGLALTKEDASDMKKYMGEASGAKATINRLIEIGETSGSSITQATRAEADSLRMQLQGLLRTQILGPGTVNDQEREMLNKIISDPTAIFSLSANNKVRLNTILQQIDRTTAGKASALGLTTPANRVGFTARK